ncbi:MAG TPA: VWA domain-containing protein, partial [Thermoanaerobaculia bacterium]|nr:VWA domain-containing protein [Thermoanaerobaculia bacterium]
LLFALTASLLGVAAAQLDQEATPAFEEQVSVGYVLVPVVVRAGAGYARNLDQEDFRLLVDGRPAPIDSFERRAEAPASVLLLQDLSGSMANGGRLELSRDVVRFFTSHALPGDEFAVATFAGDSVGVEVPFTAELSVLRESSEAWTAWGTTALHDAVAWMPEISLKGRNPKRFALLITDGVDNASKINPEQAREIVQKAQLPTYVLGLDSGNPYELSEEGEKIYRYADVLNLLAATTGGRYFSIRGREDLQEALTAILEDLRHQYVLGFPTGDGPSRFRRVQVEVKGDSRRTFVFRRGYQGPPPAASGG